MKKSWPPATPSAAVINSFNAAGKVDKDEDLEMEMAPKMLLAASNGHGLSSGGPVTTTLSPHVHCGEAMCLAPMG
jgi:hypothetical protein